MPAYEEEPKQLKPTAPRAPELGKLEAALAELTPRAVSLDRDRLMYLAGQASVGTLASPRGWRWPAAFSGMSALAATLLIMLVSRPPRIVERVVRVAVPAASAADERPEALSPDSPAPRVAAREQYLATDSPRIAVDRDRRPSPPAYRDLRDRVLAMGIETWTSQPSEGGKSSPPETYRDMLNDALRGG